MRILGIDPGTAIVGIGCLDVPDPASVRMTGIRNEVALRRGPGRLQVVEARAIRLGRPTQPIEQRLLALAEAVREVLARLAPHWLAVEEAFYGKSVQSALRIGEARGVILVAAAAAGVRVAQYPPATIKLRVAGRGSASKAGLARMLGWTLSTSLAGLPADATDALAVALCHSQCLELAAITDPESQKDLDRSRSEPR